MRLLTYNILEGGTGRIDPLAEVIRLADADVVVLQETHDGELFHKLADRLHMDRFLAENPRNPTAGTGLLTRGRIRQAVNHAPLDARLTRSAFSAAVQVHSSTLHLVGLHLSPGQTFDDEAARLREVPAIFDIARTLPASHVLAGDFNSVHPQQLVDIARLREKVRQRIAPQNNQLPRQVVTDILAAGYIDAHAAGRTHETFETSFPTSKPALRIDYIFAAGDWTGRLADCRLFTPEISRFASDHFPVVAEFR